MIYPVGEVKESDIETVRKQLGSDDVYLAGIVERCGHGYPAVVLLSPLLPPGSGQKSTEVGNRVNYTAAASMLWLTCPYLHRKIHDLESDGYIRKIQMLIQGDNLLALSMNQAHAHYYYFRKKILNIFLGSNSSIRDNMTFVTTGIGGTREIRNIKCLHLHYAHYRFCSDNVAGRLVCALLDDAIQCEEVLCRNASIKT